MVQAPQKRIHVHAGCSVPSSFKNSSVLAAGAAAMRVRKLLLRRPPRKDVPADRDCTQESAVGQRELKEKHRCIRSVINGTMICSRPLVAQSYSSTPAGS